MLWSYRIERRSLVRTALAILVTWGLLVGACSNAGDAETGAQGGTDPLPDENDRCGTGEPASELGSEFVDPQGTYRIRIGEDWERQPGLFVAEIEAWFVADPVGEFHPNVNVLTQEAPGMSLSEYLDLSGANAPELIPGAEIIETCIIDRADNHDLGVMEFAGMQAGLDLHHLLTATVKDGTAVVATFTAPESEFEDLRRAIEPYLLTLEPSSP